MNTTTTTIMIMMVLSLLNYIHAFSNNPIILKGNTVSKDAKLLLFVPGGKVPPEDYVSFVKSSQEKSASDMNLYVAIVRCGQLNLCNPLGSLNSEIDNAIEQAGVANGNNAFTSENIFIAGHSLGGVGARHYVDEFNGKSKYGTKPFAGLMLFGTQFNGDNEKFTGTLGYPENLKAFPIPLLILAGELDMLPISHIALVYKQYVNLTMEEKIAKPVVVIPGMDHSQFCSPFNVSGDLQPEISNEEALEQSSQVVSSFMLAQQSFAVAMTNRHQNYLLQIVANTTQAMTAPFLIATDMEISEICIQAQKFTINYLPSDILKKVVNIDVLVRNTSASLEHGHTKITKDSDGNLNLLIVSYAYYGFNKSFNPVERFAPSYTSADDISCKLVSGDAIAKAAGTPKGTSLWPSKSPNITCEMMNQATIKTGIQLLTKYWPASYNRWTKQGRQFQTEKDSSTFAGPQWVFASSLKFDAGSSQTDQSIPVKVTSSYLYSNIASKIFPGNYYCKLLSPAKVIEWVMTKGLTKRLS